MKQTLLSVLFFIFILMNTHAQSIKLEASLQAQQMRGDFSYFEPDYGSQKIEVDDFFAYGLGAGMNLGKFNMCLDFLFGSSDIISTDIIDVSISCVDINLEYRFLNKPLSPIISAGIGSVTYTESLTSAEELNESDFSYNFAAGAKWIIADKLFIKPVYKGTFSKIKYTTDGLIFDGVSISIGYIFPAMGGGLY